MITWPITLTEEQERFAKQFHPDVSKIDRTRKITVRHVSDRGSSTKKQGARQHDVKPDTLKKRVLQFWQIRARLRVSLASSMRLTMTIRRRLTSTTLNYRCSRSLTNETCSSRVSRVSRVSSLRWRSLRRGRGGMGEGVGLTVGNLVLVWLSEIDHCLHAGSLLRPAFRNRLKCHLLPSIILSLSLIPVNVIDYHFTYCSKRNHLIHRTL
jgi:hypothetical protein